MALRPVRLGLRWNAMLFKVSECTALSQYVQRWSDKKPSVWFVSSRPPPRPVPTGGQGWGSDLSSAFRPAWETALCSARASTSQFSWHLQTTSILRTDTSHRQATPKAESTQCNASAPSGRRSPAPRAARSAPQCALVPGLQPGRGIWRKDRGNIRQIFKTEPREQSGSLCCRAAGSGEALPTPQPCAHCSARSALPRGFPNIFQPEREAKR